MGADFDCILEKSTAANYHPRRVTHGWRHLECFPCLYIRANLDCFAWSPFCPV